MTTPATPSAPKSAGDSPKLVAVDEAYTALTFEDRLRIFWQKNGRTVLALLVVALVAIVAKGGWDYMESNKEHDLQQAYAAATTHDQLQAFAAAHPDHVLAGIARLRIADEAYATGKSADAIAGYEQAIAVLKSGPLTSRAKLGLAMAKLQAGKTADGTAALQQLANDTSEARGTRVEASYQLASLASAAGQPDDVRRYSQQIMQLDPNSPWTQRVFMLQATLPATEPAPVSGTPGIKLPGK
jgi:hypothetical protein